MPVIYEITYLPWVGNSEGKPWLYSGSDWNDSPSYLGSASSKEVREWWKQETKAHPDRFQKHSLVEITPGSVTKAELRALESAIQTAENHKADPRYFNRTNHRYGGDAPNALKGKTYDEVYGPERAAAIRQQRAEMASRTVSDETRTRLSAALTGREAHNKGVPVSDLQKAKQSEAMMGRPAWNAGKAGIYSEQQLAAIREARAQQNMGMWVTDGVMNLKVYDGQIPEGFRKGRMAPHLSLGGEAHSQFGTRWINDGRTSKKVPGDEPLPVGWTYGRASRTKELVS